MQDATEWFCRLHPRGDEPRKLADQTEVFGAAHASAAGNNNVRVCDGQLRVALVQDAADKLHAVIFKFLRRLVDDLDFRSLDAVRLSCR